MDKKITIKVISNACGVLPHTIRTWERRYNTFIPERSDKGQRYYSSEDLERAKLIVRIIDRGYSISKISHLNLSELRELLESSIDQSTETQFLVKKTTEDLFQYLKQYDVENVAKEMEHLRLSVGGKEFILEIVLPVMREIGVYVSKGEYSITQEHIVSTIIRAQLSLMNLPNMGAGSGFIIATPEGNIHELSILIADVLCRLNRYSTTYLGASHPAPCLAEATNALKSNVVLLGVISSDQWDYEKNIVSYLKKMDELLNDDIEVILGGAYEIDLPVFKNIRKVTYISSFEEFDKELSTKVR